MLNLVPRIGNVCVKGHDVVYQEMHQHKCIDLWTVINIKSKSPTCVSLHEVSEIYTWLCLLVGSTNNQTNEVIYYEKYGGYSDAQINLKAVSEQCVHCCFGTCLWDKITSATYCPLCYVAILKDGMK